AAQKICLSPPRPVGFSASPVPADLCGDMTNRVTWSCENMRLVDILKPENIKVPLEAHTKTDAITELVGVLAKNDAVADAKKVLDAVLERESTRTTGIGNGLAIPHGKCTGAKDLVMAIGKAGTPIDFQAIDGRPVSLI